MTRQRRLAIISLSAAALLVVLVAVFLIANFGRFLLGFVGLGLTLAGGWWIITERMPRRAVGIGAAVVGIGVVIGTLWAARASSDGGTTVKILLIIGLLALAAGTGRAALSADLHAMDHLADADRIHPRKPVLICNPKSGGGKVEKFGIVDAARSRGVEVIVLGPDSDLEALARDAVARGADCLGMAGGDGSQALVASVAVEHGLPFVCISAGTRNHFAQDLGLVKEDPLAGLAAFTEGVERRVDYATVGERLFVNNVSLGVYATIVQQDSYRDAKVQTTAELLPTLLGSAAEPFDLQFSTPDGTAIDGAYLVLVSNNPYVMGPSLDVSQRRSMDTGQLGVFSVNANTGPDAAKSVAAITLGLATFDPHVQIFTCADFEVDSRGGSAFAGVDGEALQLATPLRFRSHPGGLRLLVPPENLVAAAERRSRGFSLKDLVEVSLGHESPSLAKARAAARPGGR